jgi:hypothetical protein
MRRFVLYMALALQFNVLGAAAADRYGEWVLEQPRSSVVTLSFKQSVPVNNNIATSELGFVCDQTGKSKNAAVILIPFDGTFENKRGTVSVLIQKSVDQFDSSDLTQKWKNGTQYIFLESQEDANELASFLKANEAGGVRSVHFFFPNDPDGGPHTSIHIGINVLGFSDGFGAFQKACAPSQWAYDEQESWRLSS